MNDVPIENRRYRLIALYLAASAPCLAFVSPAPAGATTVSFDVSSAKATIAALDDGTLTHERALAVARMAGNQGLIRELQGFDLPATAQGFADALYDAAHGGKATGKMAKQYSMDAVRKHEPAIKALIANIGSDPDGFQKAIEARIAMFTPRGADIRLQVFVVAGGDGGGYAFGGTDFYFNAYRSPDFILAKAISNHEMYHAVQGEFAKQRAPARDLPKDSACAATMKLFDDMYEEGTATFVADQSLVNQSTSPNGIRQRTDMEDGLKHIDWSSSLLEMSVAALSAHEPVPFRQVYAVGFYGHGPLYSIGYVMARELVADRGPNGIAALLTQPSYRFILSYAELPQYGRDGDHPRLGPNTLAAAKALADGCIKRRHPPARRQGSANS